MILITFLNVFTQPLVYVLWVLASNCCRESLMSPPHFAFPLLHWQSPKLLLPHITLQITYYIFFYKPMWKFTTSRVWGDTIGIIYFPIFFFASLIHALSNTSSWYFLHEIFPYLLHIPFTFLSLKAIFFVIAYGKSDIVSCYDLNVWTMTINFLTRSSVTLRKLPLCFLVFLEK